MAVVQNFELNDIITGSVVSELLTRKLRKQKAFFYQMCLGLWYQGTRKSIILPSSRYCEGNLFSFPCASSLNML